MRQKQQKLKRVFACKKCGSDMLLKTEQGVKCLACGREGQPKKVRWHYKKKKWLRWK